MNQEFKNKIEASSKSIKELLGNQKFTIDYFQREYRWQEKHITLLAEDLVTAFFKSYSKNHERRQVRSYQSYYLGPVVFSNAEAKKSIIDGQQRLTSITLLLIYLSHRLNEDKNSKSSVRNMVFSDSYGELSFNMSDENRKLCMESLLASGEYKPTKDDDETIRNMVARYDNISEYFNKEITKEMLPFFVDWLTENVIFVEIIAYSDDNAYTIFETMNDRGLNLTQTEMLKGYVLSKISDEKKRTEINEIWKKEIKHLHEYDGNEDLAFFNAWFRAKYAKSIRPGKADSENQDFENIASRFHSWFKEEHSSLFKLEKSEDFYQFFKNKFPFYVEQYLKIKKNYKQFDPNAPHLHYINFWGIADSLQSALLLSSIRMKDDLETQTEKMNLVAQYIETYTVRKTINYRSFSQTSIKYTMFNLIKRIRNNPVDKLCECLKHEIENMEQSWDGIPKFKLHGQNRKFVKHLLSRISAHIDGLTGKPFTYVSYHHPTGKPFEIEHIWADKFDEHKDEFEQENDFKDQRNSIGALLLLPQGTNQSFNSDTYKSKLKHYLKKNTYVQTLHPKHYEKNPNFLNAENIQSLKFKPHPLFKSEDIKERGELVQRICEQIWSVKAFE